MEEHEDDPPSTTNIESVNSNHGIVSDDINPNNIELITPREESSELSDIYCFETDHVALKGNADYQKLLKTICILQAQRIQAVKDIDTLHYQQAKALEDPIGFVETLQKGDDLQFPKAFNIPSLPMINWDQYTNSVDFSSFGNHRHLTRIKRQLTDGTSDEPNVSSSLRPKEGQSHEDAELDKVRGRLKDSNKPATFNVLWTIEEQKRLEELLIRYPPEEVEARRWNKIAAALGNRTPQQVASRIQKYFLKLAKAGLPIPGRTPSVKDSRKMGGVRSNYSKYGSTTSSTFLQSHEPPVYMSDDEDTYSQTGSWSGFNIDNNSHNRLEEEEEVSDEEEIPKELRNTPEYQELLRLKFLKTQKLSKSNRVKHEGYKCDNCGCDPIIGTRWNCTDCPVDNSVDFCDFCVDSNIDINQHNSSHRLKPISTIQSKTALDQDYMKFMSGDYNYLDPNYMPAS